MQREETQKEREQIQATIAENKRLDQDQAARLRDQNTAYYSDLRGQIDYNRRQRGLMDDEQRRVEERQKEAELEYQRKVEYLRGKPVMQRIHPTRRGLYQSQSAGARYSHRDHPGTMNH